MLKKLILYLSVLVPITLFSAEIIDYKLEHKKAITAICFQDTNKSFGDFGFFNKIGLGFTSFGIGVGLIGNRLESSIGRNSLYTVAALSSALGVWTLLDNKFDFSGRKKNELEELLNDLNKQKKVLINNSGEVMGMCAYFLTKEKSLIDYKESLNKNHGNKILLKDEDLLKCFPNLKKTPEECKMYSVIELIAVAKNKRGNGYGTKLIKDALKCTKEQKSTYAVLNVANGNIGAKKLYERLGFTACNVQPLGFGFMGITQMSKTLD